MINKLIKLSDRLDRSGLNKEADLLDAVINKLSTEQDWDSIGSNDEYAIRSAKKVAEMIIGGTPIIGEDADTAIDELAEILSKKEHSATISAVLDYFERMNQHDRVNEARDQVDT